jgi:hypothetical protein
MDDVLVYDVKDLLSDKAFMDRVKANRSEQLDAPAEQSGEGWEGRIEGACPVQGYGTVGARTWYFRARGDAWSFEVFDGPFQPDGGLPAGDAVWLMEREFGVWPDAGWMKSSVAWGFIREALTAYHAWLESERA